MIPFRKKNNQFPCIDRLHSGGLIPNYVCSSTCAHCVYNCSPKREKDYIDQEMVRHDLNKIRSLGCRSVHIGGGEPMLNFEKLKMVVRTASECDVGIEYIETNSSWYHDIEDAIGKLKELQDIGINCLLLSISPFHNSYIPFSKVKGVMNACRFTGVNIFPWIADFIQDVESFDDKTTHSLEEYREKFGERYWENLPGKYYLTFRGRALKTFRDQMREIPLEKILAGNRGGCFELTDTSHFHVDLYGNYIPGLCTGLAIQVEDLNTELTPEKYPFFCGLFQDGINGFCESVVEKYDFKPKKNYVSKCDLCYDIRYFLVNEQGYNGKDIQPHSYYSE